MRELISQWLHRTLGLRGSAHGNGNVVSDVMHNKRTHGGMGVLDVINIYIECMTSTWLAGAHSHVPVFREAYMSCISTQADAAIAVSLSRSITEQHTPSMNRLFSLFCMGIRVHKEYAPLGSWCRAASPPPDNGRTNPEAAWQEQIANHLAPSPGRHIYPPASPGSTICGCGHSSCPPLHTVLLLIPTVPLAPVGRFPECTSDPLAPTGCERKLPSHTYVGVVSLPEAIFHANHTVRYPVSVRAVRRDPTSTRVQDLSTVAADRPEARSTARRLSSILDPAEPAEEEDDGIGR